jgi:opacity protein-like surface antigen
MKKLLIMAMALLVSGTLLAQESKTTKSEPKSFIAFHAGPSFPVADFSSTDMANNPDAGFAKTGINLNLTYGYRFQKSLALAGSLLFNQNKINKGSITYKDETSGQDIVLKMDHWQFYGVAAGPVITLPVGNKVYADFKVMIGAVNANAPQISYQGVELTKESWNVAPLYQGGVGLRMDAGKSMFILAGADYMYLKPTFIYTFTGAAFEGVPTDFKQKMSVLNVTAGVGFKF